MCSTCEFLVLNNQNDEEDNVLLATHCELNTELQETIFTQQNNTTIIILIVFVIVLLGAIASTVICSKEKKNKVQ